MKLDPRAIAIGAVVVAALLGGMLLARPGEPNGARPTLRISAESLPLAVGQDPGAFVPTVTVWYADGSRGEGSRALPGPWRPDRPVRMVTVVASVSCAILVDDELVVTEGAAVNRVAVCLWAAP